jgi:(p)ppGpp synthase/HD superfamily hydrolase
MATLEAAILLAAQAHQGQADKAGAPYILHPLRMMLTMPSEEAMMAAVLHDVVEDTATTLEDLRRMGFPESVVVAVECLTRRDGESYEAFIERVAQNPLARTVKLADLEDNMDVRRLAGIGEGDWRRLQRYREAWASLTKLPPS